MANVFTLDIEDYWSIFLRYWLNKNAGPSEAVVRNTEWFLDTLARYNIKATCFILGEVAQKYPYLIEKIAQDGHEIASHGFSHKQIFHLNRRQFCEEIVSTKHLLEDITGQAVLGYRAPAFSITPKTVWALEMLAEEGYRYDSSVYPISGKRYGWPGFSKDICKINLPSGRSIIEVPMSTVSVFGKALPMAGGGYIRHFPYAVTRWAMKNILKERPAIVYMHPYETDIEDRCFDTAGLSKKQLVRALMFHKMQLRNRKTVSSKLVNLLREFEFTSISEVIPEVINKNKYCCSLACRVA